MDKETFNQLQDGDLILAQRKMFAFNEKFKKSDDTLTIYFMDINCKDIELITPEYLKAMHDKEIAQYEKDYQERVAESKETIKRILYNKEPVAATILASAIGLRQQYKLPNPTNKKGQPLKRYTAYRNSYNISPGCSRYADVQKLCELGYMEEIAKDYYQVTNKGKTYIEKLFNLKVKMNVINLDDFRKAGEQDQC